MVPQAENLSAPACILVVEDEILIRVMIAEELRDAGFTVIEAVRADEALSYFQLGHQVDLVFSDIQIPGPLNGVELARQLRDDHPNLPIILTSGNFGAQSAEGLGMFIAKPYDLPQVVAIITATLGK